MIKITKEQYEKLIKEAKDEKDLQRINNNYSYDGKEPELPAEIKQQDYLEIINVREKFLIAIDKWFQAHNVLTQQEYAYLWEISQLK